MKYLEDMIRNPKFEGFKVISSVSYEFVYVYSHRSQFPTVKHVQPLETQFNQIFPADFLHLFKVNISTGLY